MAEKGPDATRVVADIGGQSAYGLLNTNEPPDGIGVTGYAKRPNLGHA